MVDASVLPIVTNGNIDAPTMMVAERAADRAAQAACHARAMTDLLIMRRPAQFHGGNRDICDTQSLDSVEDDGPEAFGRVARDASLVAVGSERLS